MPQSFPSLCIEGGEFSPLLEVVWLHIHPFIVGEFALTQSPIDDGESTWTPIHPFAFGLQPHFVRVFFLLLDCNHVLLGFSFLLLDYNHILLGFFFLLLDCNHILLGFFLLLLDYNHILLGFSFLLLDYSHILLGFFFCFWIAATFC